MDAHEVDRLVDKVKPLLAGYHPAVQGAALADLLAIWLCSHHADTGAERLREHLLKMHIKTVRELVAENMRTIG